MALSITLSISMNQFVIHTRSNLLLNLKTTFQNQVLSKMTLVLFFTIYAVMFTIAPRKVSLTLIFAAKSNGRIFSKVATPFPRAVVCRLYSVGPTKKDILKASQSYFGTKLGSKPEINYFSNPEIQTDWEFRQEEGTNIKYYFNKVTQDKVLINPVLKDAPRLQRIYAGLIDTGISLGACFDLCLICSWCKSCLFIVIF